MYFETYSSTLKDILTGLTKVLASLEIVTDSILAQLDKFRFVSFSHVKKDGNRPAHILAQFVKQVGHFVVWLEETANLTEDVCSQDVSRFVSKVLFPKYLPFFFFFLSLS